MGARLRLNSGVDVAPDRLHQFGSRSADTSGADVYPLRLAQEILEPPRQRRGARVKRNNPAALGGGPFDLFAHVWRRDRMPRENEYDNFGIVDGANDLV